MDNQDIMKSLFVQVDKGSTPSLYFRIVVVQYLSILLIQVLVTSLQRFIAEQFIQRFTIHVEAVHKTRSIG